MSIFAPLLSILLEAFLFSSALCAPRPITPEAAVEKMEEAYAGVDSYQTVTEVTTYEKDGSVDVKKFLYTFKKPNRMRMDFQSPYHGMVIIYPDKNGEVLIHEFLTFHRTIDDPVLIDKTTGQRVDQTDIGLLIHNISQSIGEKRKGLMEITEDDAYVRIRVLAEDHFCPGITALYEFGIQKKLWLPIEVQQSAEEGRLIRIIVFQNLRINPPLPDDFFTRD